MMVLGWGRRVVGLCGDWWCWLVVMKVLVMLVGAGKPGGPALPCKVIGLSMQAVIVMGN